MRLDPILVYFLLTPVFAIADFVLGWNIRIAGLGSPSVRIGYYLALMLFALVAWRWRRLEPALALLESALNLALLLVAMATRIMLIPDDTTDVSPPGPRELLNFLIVGSIGIYAFQLAQHRLRQLSK